MSYAYTYPHDLTFLDQEFGRAGRLRELAGAIWSRATEEGLDLYDVVEDWADLSDEDRMRMHLGFGGTEEEVLALQARDHRYTLTRNPE